MPKVSVIIPTHNRCDFLQNAIRSVLNQTYQDFEIIIVDDASTDDTPRVMPTITDERIRYVRHPSNKGDAASRNTGIRHAHGDYIAFLDDDDAWLPEKLELQVKLLERSPEKTGGVYTGSLTADGISGRVVGVKWAVKKRQAFHDMFLDNFIATSSVLLRKQCFEQAGIFDERIPYNSDYDMWIRIARAFDFECLSEPLFIYHTHQKKLNTNLDLVVRGHEMMLDKYREFFAMNPKNMSRVYHTLGVLYALSHNGKQSRKALFNAMKLHPSAFSHYAAFLCSFLGPGALKTIIKLRDAVAAPWRSRRMYREMEKTAASTMANSVRAVCRS